MTSALAYKELREILGITVLGLAALLIAALSNMGYSIAWFLEFDTATIPLVSDGFAMSFSFICGLLAIALGLRQSIADFSGSAQWFLLHRPVTRVQMYGTKLAVGLAVLLACGGSVIALYVWWASTPGTHASPFEWSMTGDLWWSWLVMTAVYLGAFLTGIRPAAWFGTRLAPLFASLALVLVSMAFGWSLALPLLLFADGLLIAAIFATVQTREFG